MLSATGIDPRMLPMLNTWWERAAAALAPSTMKITVTWRDAADQNAAAANGASKAKAGQSPHNCVDVNGDPCSRAIDFAIMDATGAYVKNGEDPRYATAGRLAEGAGLFWAGRWTLKKDGCGPDYDHIQMMNWRTVPTYNPDVQSSLA